MEAIGLALMILGVVGALSQLWLIPIVFKDEDEAVSPIRKKRARKPWHFEPPAPGKIAK